MQNEAIHSYMVLNEAYRSHKVKGDGNGPVG